MKKLEEGHVLWLRLPFDKTNTNISNDRHPYIIIERTDQKLHLLQGDSYTDDKAKKDKDKLKDPYIDILPVQSGLLDKPGYVQMDNIITIDNIESSPNLINNKKILRTNEKLDKIKLEHLKHNYKIKIKVKIKTGKFNQQKKFHVPLSVITLLETFQEFDEDKREKEKLKQTKKQIEHYNSMSKKSKNKKPTKSRK